MLKWLEEVLDRLNPLGVDQSDPFNEAVSHQTIRHCQLAIRKDRYHGGAHVLLANAYSLAAPIDPPEAYKFCIERAAAVIYEWKTNRRMYTKQKNARNGKKLYQSINARIEGEAGLGMFADIPFGSMAECHQRYYGEAIHERSLNEVKRLLGSAPVGRGT